MKNKSFLLGERFVKEGLNEDIVKESQELDVIIVKKQKQLFEQYLKEKKSLIYSK